ncbi:MAG: BglG family transcription antiterminator [Lactimicrobium massiliense]
MTDRREIEAVRFLYLADSFVSADALADHIHVKPRTLRELMNHIREEMRDNGADLLLKSNRGYCLEIHDPEVFMRYLKRQSKWAREQQFDRPVTVEDRCDWIIRRLLLDSSVSSWDELADVLFVSRSTLASDLKTVRSKLAEYHLSLVSIPGEGICIKGAEAEIRACISDYCFYNDYVNSTSFQRHPMGEFRAAYDETVLDIVQQTIRCHGYHMTDVGLHNLVVHLMIALYREANGISQREEAPVLSQEQFVLEFTMSREIRDLLFRKLQIFLPDESLPYMVIHLAGTRIFTVSDERLITEETLNLVKIILTNILDAFGIDFFSDLDLFTMLCTHIQPMLNRLRMHVKMRNPLLPQIRFDEPVGYDMAVFAARLISEQCGESVSEHEIGYLALHFQLAIERRKQADKKKVLVVCASGAGTSRMLAYRLQSQFGDRISEIQSAGVHDLKEMNADAFDYIFSTVPLKIQTRARIIQIDSFLSDGDMRGLVHTFDTSKQDVGRILQAFDSSLFLADCSAVSKADVIHQLCQKLNEAIEVPSDFEEKVLHREKFSSTNMGNGVAIPHPEVLMLEETKVVAAHLREPVSWAGEKVNWVFLLGMDKKDNEISEPLVHALDLLIHDTVHMNKLNRDPSYNCFISIMNDLLTMGNQREKESIFR